MRLNPTRHDSPSSSWEKATSLILSKCLMILMGYCWWRLVCFNSKKHLSKLPSFWRYINHYFVKLEQAVPTFFGKEWYSVLFWPISFKFRTYRGVRVIRTMEMFQRPIWTSPTRPVKHYRCKMVFGLKIEWFCYASSYIWLLCIISYYMHSCVQFW